MGTAKVHDLTPHPKFYDLFDEVQVSDIVTSLKLQRAIPLQYGYVETGAEYWARFAEQMLQSERPNALNRNLEMLRLNSTYLDELVAGHDRVDIVDVGPGDGRPVKEYLERLQQRRLLGRYIAVDLSDAMLAVATRNVRTWLGGTVKVAGHSMDITRQGFGHLLVGQEADTLTIALLLGGTLCNFPDPDAALRNIHRSLRPGDIFIHAAKTDTEQNRRFFNIGADASGRPALPENQRLVLDLLNIQPELYDVEMGYDLSLRRRYTKVRLREAINIAFTRDGAGDAVLIDEGETILVWYCWHQHATEVMTQMFHTGFYPLQLSQHPDKQYLLCISMVEPQQS